MKTQTKKSTLKHMTLKLGVLDNAKYTQDDLVDILEHITFELVNVNLSAKKTLLGFNGNGFTSVGFVNSFNPKDCTFQVVVLEKFAPVIEGLGEVVVTARAFTNKDGNITKVIGLDVEPVAK